MPIRIQSDMPTRIELYSDVRIGHMPIRIKRYIDMRIERYADTNTAICRYIPTYEWSDRPIRIERCGDIRIERYDDIRIERYAYTNK